jgi:hypothetical protein
MPSTWPTTLPEVRQQDYGVAAELPVVRTTMESNRPRVQRTNKTIMRNITCSFILNNSQSKTFWNFFEVDGNAGADWFYMPVLTGNNISQHLARFASYPQLRMVRDGLYEINFTLETDQQVVI